MTGTSTTFLYQQMAAYPQILTKGQRPNTAQVLSSTSIISQEETIYHIQFLCVFSVCAFVCVCVKPTKIIICMAGPVTKEEGQADGCNARPWCIT